jgi:hypothetical protein
MNFIVTSALPPQRKTLHKNEGLIMDCLERKFTLYNVQPFAVKEK